jgi:CHAT domain-containing protein/tetratricopeptide (TPR) repeat protein
MRRSAWTIILVVTVGLSGGSGKVSQTEPANRPLITQGLAHAHAGRMEQARQILRKALDLATSGEDSVGMGDAFRALAEVASRQGDVGAASALFEKARAAYERAEAREELGHLANHRGNDANRRSAYEEGERYYLEALHFFRSVGNLADQAAVLRNLTLAARLSIDQELAILDEALSLARTVRDRQREGLILHSQGDRLFVAGNYASALAHTEESLRLLEEIDPRSIHFARALTSLGRLKRVLGEPAESLRLNGRAVTLLAAAGDFDGAAQASHAMAVALVSQEPGTLGYIPLMDRALDFARKSTRARTLPWTLGNYAELIANHGGPLDEALRLLDEVDRLGPPNEASLRAKALVLEQLGNKAEALALIDRALEQTHGESTYQRSILNVDRSRLLEGLGRIVEAIDSSTQAISLVERVRHGLVPADETRRSYAERWHNVLARHVGLLARVGRVDEALVASEHSRARAFVDLLAAREEQARGPVRSAAVPPAAPVQGLAMRGSETRRFSTVEDLVADIRRRIPAESSPPRLAALDAALAAPPVTRADIVAAAASLRSHLLIYWVAEQDTAIWVVSPDGRMTSAKSAIGAAKLAALVRSTWAAAASPARGSADDAETLPAWTQALRGEGRLSFDATHQEAFRELHRALIAPVQASLPSGEDALATIIPHGPLFRLSFAPLLSPSGRYLIESLSLSYAPSVAALVQTARRPPSGAGVSLVVADPELPPGIARRERLARLPGASAEGRAVSDALGGRTTTLLRGAAASESRVRGAMAGRRVVHFATHGVIRDDQPMASFLALAGSGSSPDDDGRLTTAEVYELSLKADLVVLSACRSALGPVTGDGITGLTRAFFGAGTRSVIASLWDLPDVVTAPLLSRFYREWERSSSKAAGLRRAQLHMIGQLRAGRMVVDTPAGKFVVPEHPSLWAGLVLVGEPH